jgi:hypothetical protein
LEKIFSDIFGSESDDEEEKVHPTPPHLDDRIGSPLVDSPVEETTANFPYTYNSPPHVSSLPPTPTSTDPNRRSQTNGSEDGATAVGSTMFDIVKENLPVLANTKCVE